MNNYLLSVDPSMKNTGFTLWEYNGCELTIKEKQAYYWKPILITSVNFKNVKIRFILKEYLHDNFNINDNLDLVIERGIFNPKFGRGKETLDHLRGFIAGKFNKLLTKDMLISPKQWRKWYIDNINNEIINFDWIGIGPRKWDKELSLEIANYLSKLNNWNITIKDHDQAESLLIGWYWINKDVK